VCDRASATLREWRDRAGQSLSESVLIVKLQRNSLKWALNYLYQFGDTDLFPRLIEIDALKSIETDAINVFEKIDLGNYSFGSARRFIVPKDEISYRTATQLDPIDTVFLTAAIYEYGSQIEKRRISVKENRIFSYRFLPQANALYDQSITWVDFWNHCRRKAIDYSHIVRLDIADFYNQIYHHNVENQLIESQFPNQVKKWIINLLESTTAKVSRGIPIGPHATHLLAEMSLIPIDNSMFYRGIDFCRYADDVIIFCHDYTRSKIVIYQIAEILDKQQKLVLQKQKTKIYKNSIEFREHCSQMIEDRPINENERKIITLIKNYSHKNPYKTVSMSNLSDEEIRLFDQTIIESIIQDYLISEAPNYSRLRWFLRRLSQIGTPAAVEYCINNINDLTPAISDVCNYLVAVTNNYAGNWQALGNKIMEILNSDLIKSSEFLQMTLLSLFVRNVKLNNVNRLIALYSNSPPSIRREIILGAYQANAIDWIRELKESYSGFDIWLKQAFVMACKGFPEDEKRFFLDHAVEDHTLMNLLKKWSKQR